MIKIKKLLANSFSDFNGKRKTLCAVVERDGFPDQKIAVSKLVEALPLLVPVIPQEDPKASASTSTKTSKGEI